MGKLFGEVGGEGSDGVSGYFRIGGKIHGHAAVDGWVVGDGLEEDGELIVGLDGLGKEIKVGEVFVEGGKVGGEVVEVFEGNGEEGFECGDVGGLGGAMFLLHHGHHITTCNQHHSVDWICQQECVGWSDGEDKSVQQRA